MPILAVILSVEDLVLLAVCGGLGLVALVFFLCIFIADAKDARRRREAKKAFERARKHFAPDQPDLGSGKEIRH